MFLLKPFCINLKGEYEYLGTAFGDLPAFLFVWSFVVIVIPASFALTALTFADYALQPFFLDCLPPNNARLILAALAIGKELLLIIINSIKFR